MRPGQPAERRRPADHLLEVVHPPVVDRRHRDDLLGQHVQRVVRDLQLLDLARPHAPGHHGRLDQVALVLGEDDAAGDIADVVPGPADPLQPAGHRRRRLDLDHQVHRAHVDAEFQAGGRHHGGQPPGLERLLDFGPLLPRHRPVVRPRHLRGRARSGTRLRHQLGRDRTTSPRTPPIRAPALPPPRRPPPHPPSARRGQLVQPAAQPLGQPPRVREHDRGLVLLDQVEHPLLDVRPDGAPRRGALLVTAARVAPRHRVQLGHVLDRHDHLQLDALGAGRLHDGDRAGAAEERRHLLDRPHGRRQPHPLGWPGGTLPGPSPRGGRLRAQRVQAFQGQRQVGAALVARHRVHLVEDDRLHPAQGLPGLRGEQQEERLGGGDEDVRRLGRQLPALLGGGVAGAHRHPDVRLVQAQPARGVPDPGQRGAQVPLDVHRQRLERGDVEHPGTPLRVGGRRQRRQLVDRPQERGQRLTRTGRRDHQRVLALADRPPRPGLSLRRLGERAVEPRPGGRREPVKRPVRRGRGAGGVPGQGRVWCHDSIVPRPTDISAARCPIRRSRNSSPPSASSSSRHHTDPSSPNREPTRPRRSR